MLFRDFGEPDVNGRLTVADEKMVFVELVLESLVDAFVDANVLSSLKLKNAVPEMNPSAVQVL
jgi:hypothetical protein